ncbi:hypothetical protein UZ36_03275 [Candidatus Nitromaritima sp. SCGC AAA799-C22]|nr:hypothetical protein UZ36_03275 [Candidatus Nitromaritima sp. SCGC AAA799-C22]
MFSAPRSISDFTHEHLKEEIEREKIDWENSTTLMLEHERYVEERLSEIKPQAEKLKKEDILLVACPEYLEEPRE